MRRGFSSPSSRTCAARRSGWERFPGGVVACDLDAEFFLAAEPNEGDDPHYLTSTHPDLADDLTVGQSVLFADGTVAMDVVARGPGWAQLKVTLPGQIRSHQGINVPGRD